MSVLTEAQGLGQAPRITQIEEIVVRGERVDGSVTAVSADAARRELRRIPGAIGFVEAEEFADDFAQSIGDTLLFTPGVFADTSAQRENRISVRGSGLNSSFERRGIALYRDGVPITRASGSTEFQEFDPASVAYIEVYKGANGLRYGGTSLGGVINLVTPSALTREERFTARAETGSFDTLRGNLTYAQQQGNADIFAAYTRLKSEGYRDHSAVDSHYGFLNVGFQLGENIENRTHITGIRDHFELAGSLSLADALADNSLAGRPVTVGPFFPGGPVTVLDPGPEADDWDRNLEVLRVSNRTAISLDRMTVVGGTWYATRSLDHAITRFAGIIDQEEDEIGLFLRATGNAEAGALPLSWILGLEVAGARTDARRYENLSGGRGELTSRSDQDASNVLLYGQIDLELTEQWTVIGSLQAARAERESRSRLNSVDGDVTRQQINPRLGLLWRPGETVEWFANISRGFEPASTADLTAGGALPFTPLRAQRAITAELGGRGEHGPLSWDIAVYRSELRNELLSFGEPGTRGFVSFTDNAGDTLHQGIELGMDLGIARQTLSNHGLQLLWRNIYTLNDFRFDDDAEYGNNRLAGVPEQVYISELRLDSQEGWYLGLNLRWIPDGPFVDFANTSSAPGYHLFGATAGYQLSPEWRVFLSGENLADEAHISNTGTNANQELENADLFTPGQGRALFLGVDYRL
jgi:iron complex outermembrane receptor protein